MRDNTYTMVFSREQSESPDTMGWGLAVPCRNDIWSASDLIVEAKALWAAEQPKESAPGPVCAKWGAVALLINPKKTLHLEALRIGWAEHVRMLNHPIYAKFPSLKDDQREVSCEGILNIDWPQDESGQPLALDSLLATATEPTFTGNKAYAVPKDIAKAWRVANQKHKEYFCKNRTAGIITADDDEILRHLEDTS